MIALMFSMMGIAIGALGTLVLLIIIGPLLLLWLWLCARMLRRAGFSGWWALVNFVPPLAVVMFWVFAFIDWPNEKFRVLPPSQRLR